MSSDSLPAVPPRPVSVSYAFFAHVDRGQTSKSGISSAFRAAMVRLCGPALLSFQDYDRKYLGTILVPAEFDIRKLLTVEFVLPLYPTVRILEIVDEKGEKLFASLNGESPLPAFLR